MALGLPGGIASGNYMNALFAVILFAVGVKILGTLAKYDPDAMQVFRRAMQYKGVYMASSRVSKTRPAARKDSISVVICSAYSSDIVSEYESTIFHSPVDCATFAMAPP